MSTESGAALSALILDLFRLNSRLTTMGDRLVEGLGLTSARWQVLGAILLADRPEPVAWIARDLGGNRQNVQRIVNDLHRDGLVDFEPNPHHKRAQLVVLTEKGRTTFEKAMALWTPWANSLANGLSVTDIETTGAVLEAMRRRLEDVRDGDDD